MVIPPGYLVSTTPLHLPWYYVKPVMVGQREIVGKRLVPNLEVKLSRPSVIFEMLVSVSTNNSVLRALLK